MKNCQRERERKKRSEQRPYYVENIRPRTIPPQTRGKTRQMSMSATPKTIKTLWKPKEHSRVWE